MMIGHPPKSKRFWLCLALTAFLVTVLGGLGVWQLQRLQWKETLIASLHDKETIAMAPALKPSEVSPGNPEPVLFFGRYRPEYAIFIRNGNHMIVYMPFETEDGTMILMRRGIMHVDDMAGKVISHVTGENGEISVVGVPLPRPWHIPLISQPDPNAVMWTLLDWNAVETKLKDKKLAPYMIAVLSEPEDTLEITQYIPTPRNEHLQYAVFWFGMAIVAAALFGRFLLFPPRREEV